MYNFWRIPANIRLFWCECEMSPTVSYVGPFGRQVLKLLGELENMEFSSWVECGNLFWGSYEGSTSGLSLFSALPRCQQVAFCTWAPSSHKLGPNFPAMKIWSLSKLSVFYLILRREASAQTYIHSITQKRKKTNCGIFLNKIKTITSFAIPNTNIIYK